ncbi:MAG: SDR family NAD(P)-dependent oxidoreductase [Myxococcota bacterium]
MVPIRRLFVTGASTGLGFGLADHYAREETHLGLVARRENLLQDHAKRWQERGAQVEIYPGDVADTGFMRASAEHFLDAAGGCDLVFANAGVSIPNRTLQGESDDVAWLMGVNVVGVTNTVLPFVPALCRQGSGVLCAVSSVAGHGPLPGRAAYSASKAAVTTFMSSLRMDLSGTGVHAMALCPGFVETPLTEGNPNMPFLISLDEAVREMAGAIEARKHTYSFPTPMRWLSRAMRLVPESWVQRLAPAAKPDDA